MNATVYALLLVSGVLSARTWTSVTGSQIDADLVEHKGDSVLLRTYEHKELSLKFKQLSKEDQKYLNGLADGSLGVDPLTKGGNAWTNWDAPWPKLIKTSSNDFEIEVLSESVEEGVYIYESPHFSFLCDVQLTKSLVKKFAWYFESTHAYVEALPLSFSRTQEGKKHKIRLFENLRDYYRNGGPKDSAGVYMGRQDIVMVPLESVGVKKVGSRYSVDYDGDNKTLSHEIVHSLTDFSYYQKGSLGWFTEGVAEYVGITPYRSGIYMPSKSAGAIEPYVTAYGKDNTRGRALGEKIHVGPLESFMNMSYERFTDDANFNYGVGALIVTYFCDLNREKELKNLQSFLKALKDGKSEQPAIDALLNGRSYEELAQLISKKWKSKGVELTFD